MSFRPLFHSAFAILRRTISVRDTPGLAFIVYLMVWLTRLITLTLGNFFAPSSLFLLGKFLFAFPVFVSVWMKFLSAGPTMVAGFGIESEYEGPLIHDSSPDHLWVLRVGLPSPSFFPRFADFVGPHLLLCPDRTSSPLSQFSFATTAYFRRGCADATATCLRLVFSFGISNFAEIPRNGEFRISFVGIRRGGNFAGASRIDAKIPVLEICIDAGTCRVKNRRVRLSAP